MFVFFVESFERERDERERERERERHFFFRVFSLVVGGLLCGSKKEREREREKERKKGGRKDSLCKKKYLQQKIRPNTRDRSKKKEHQQAL